jgi:hypothetical protein
MTLAEIAIKNESFVSKAGRAVTRHRLYVGGSPIASVVAIEGRVELCWEVYGPQTWPEARTTLQGLVKLGALADGLLPKVAK